MTSNEGQDNIDQTLDYDYMLALYETDISARKEWDLVFHRVQEELGGKTDARQLIEWVLKDGLGLDYGQRIEKAERFGVIYEDMVGQIQPIRVKMSTAEDCREILRRAKNLRLRKEFGRIYIHPYLSRPRLDEIRRELEQKLHEFKENGYTGATIAFWRIVQFVNGEPQVLYTPQTLTAADEASQNQIVSVEDENEHDKDKDSVTSINSG